VGFKNSLFNIISSQSYKYGLSIILNNIVDKLTWRMVVVYGTPYEETKMEFIDELHIIMTDWDGPTLLGGDFNIVISQLEKVMD
jgi:hypothetical protein